MNDCSRCKRKAAHGLLDTSSLLTIWYCTFHWNKLIRDRRIERSRSKSTDRRTPEQPE